MLNEMFADGSLQNYISKNLADPWLGTPFQGYVYMSPKQKGEFGERFTSKYLSYLKHNVEKAETSTAGVSVAATGCSGDTTGVSWMTCSSIIRSGFTLLLY